MTFAFGGWLGRLLGPLRGFAQEARRPVMVGEYVELEALYQLEAEELEQDRHQQEANARGMWRR